MFGEAQLTKAQLLTGVDGVTRSKKIARNTVQYWLADGTECIKYHDTVVVMKAPDGVITLNSGGFRTVTTKDRIWEYGHISLTQRNGVWYMPDGSAFYDGIRVVIEPIREGEYRGRCQIISGIVEANDSKVKKMKARIKKFCDTITSKKLPYPDTGDCWYCLMKGDKSGGPKTAGKPLGDIAGNHTHLISHMQEKHANGSLIVNAMHESGYGDEQIRYYYSAALRDDRHCLQMIRRAVAKYLQRRLIPDIAVK